MSFFRRSGSLVLTAVAVVCAAQFLAAGEISPQDTLSLRLLFGTMCVVSFGGGLWLARSSAFLTPVLFFGLAVACGMVGLAAFAIGDPRPGESVSPARIPLQILSAVGGGVFLAAAIWVSLPKANAQERKESGRRTSPLLMLLAIANFLNAGYPAFMSIDLLKSPLPLENHWGIFVGLSTAGMVGLAVCLLVRGKHAWVAASACLLLLALHAAVILPLGLSDTQGMGGGMLVFIGLIGTGLFSIVPGATLVFTLVLRRKNAHRFGHAGP